MAAAGVLRLAVLLLAAAAAVSAQDDASGDEAAPPSCIEVYSGNPAQPCPPWSVGDYPIAPKKFLDHTVWSVRGKGAEGLLRWHPRNGWIIGKTSDMTGMSYRCLKGDPVGSSPLGCESYGGAEDVCKVRECGTAPPPAEVGSGGEL